MERSESLVEFTKALSKFQGEITSVKKTAVNPFFKSKYADLDAVWDMCRKPLSSNGFALVQIPVELEGKLYLETLLIHTSGEYIKGYLALNPKAIDPQAIGSALTYARRYAMSAMLGVSADEDEDAERATAKDTERLRERPSQAGRPVRIQAPSPDGVPPAVVTTPPQQTAYLSDQLRADVAASGMTWTNFEIQVLGAEWPTWVKRAGTPDAARKRWEGWKLQQEKKEDSHGHG